LIFITRAMASVFSGTGMASLRILGSAKADMADSKRKRTAATVRPMGQVRRIRMKILSEVYPATFFSKSAEVVNSTRAV
jgi:hypothetical protein